MKISPRELREAQIPSKAFGFNQDVVDALLERAADTIEGLIEENRQLFETLERLRNEGTSAPASDPFSDVEPVPQQVVEPEPATVAPVSSVDEQLLLAEVAQKEELINKTLMLAQKTADETVKTAKEQAEQLVVQAKEEAQKLVSDAQENAQNVTGEAKEQADNELRAAQEQAQNLIAAAQTQADELVQEAQVQADSIHAEERIRFVELVTNLKNERAQLLSDIEILQGFDETNRSKIKEILEGDLASLKVRERVNVGDIPELPVVEPIEMPTVAAHSSETSSAQSQTNQDIDIEKPLPQSFDDMLDEPVQEASSDDDLDDVLVSEDIDVESYDHIETVEPAGGSDAQYSSQDPFAAFVDPVMPENKDSSSILDAQVVEPASDELTSTGSTGAFAPGTPGSVAHDSLDDDDFFASLREAVQDNSPLGPSDDDGDGPKKKGLFKK